MRRVEEGTLLTCDDEIGRRKREVQKVSDVPVEEGNGHEERWEEYPKVLSWRGQSRGGGEGREGEGGEGGLKLSLR